MGLVGTSRTLAIALAAAVVFTLGGFGYRYGVRDHVLARNFDVVQTGKLYRSGRLTPATTEQVVRGNGIKTIVDLGAFCGDTADRRVADQTAAALGVKRFQFALQGDGSGDPQMYVDALKIIADPANQPVLVHCAAGSERTSACVMLYRKAFEGKGFDETYAEAIAHKHWPQRNPELRKYLDRWGDAIVEALKTGQPIEQSAQK
ncbi:MAG: fused DSP-PTPase phosphatase/NAD kinase-like protein [Phycisphaerales bacterium]